MTEKSFVVVPFFRLGTSLGPRQALLFDAEVQARVAARQIASQVAGVAVIAREIDPENGADKDTVIEEFGAIPPRFPSGLDWTMRLN